MPTPGHPYDTEELAELRSAQRRLARVLPKHAYEQSRRIEVTDDGDELLLEFTLRRLLRNRIEALPIDTEDLVHYAEECRLGGLLGYYLKFPVNFPHVDLAGEFSPDATETRAHFEELDEQDRKVLIVGLGLADALAAKAGDLYEDPRLT